MTYQNRLIIIIRMAGIYFLWNFLQALVIFIAVLNIPSDSNATSASSLSPFTGSGPINLKFIQITAGATTSIYAAIGFFLIKWAKRCAQWLTKGATELKVSEINFITGIRLIGIVFLVFTLQGFLPTLPKILTTSEYPLKSPEFFSFGLQVIISLLLIFQAKKMINLINRVDR